MASLSAYEAERLVESLRTFQIEEVGTPAYMLQHAALEQLNVTAHAHVLAHSDEFVVENIVLHKKAPVLVHELLVSEVWNGEIPRRLGPRFSDEFDKKSVKPYLLRYHESVLVNLLECVLYHSHAAASLEETALELVDYAARQMLLLLDDQLPRDASRQEPFSRAVASVTLVRFIAEHATALPLGVATTILDKFDIPVLVSQILNGRPWLRKVENPPSAAGTKANASSRQKQTQKFVDNKWIPVQPDSDDRLTVTPLEAQLWLLLVNILCSAIFRERYEITPSRKEALASLKRHFNEVLVDQIPVLADLHRAIEEVNLMQLPSTFLKRAFVVEEMSFIRENLLRLDFDSLAKRIATWIFFESNEERQAVVESMARLYESGDFEAIAQSGEGDPKCAVCGKRAEHRCSRCKNEWYCSRECQVAGWKKHKPVCDLMATGAGASSKA